MEDEPKKRDLRFEVEPTPTPEQFGKGLAEAVDVYLRAPKGQGKQAVKEHFLRQFKKKLQ
ncbi:MAG TPA: hypothetical protein VLE48_11705 [Terriglobales bacterium]|nr:hypothetical protein [Terriglobales bacterium]